MEASQRGKLGCEEVKVVVRGCVCVCGSVMIGGVSAVVVRVVCG